MKNSQKVLVALAALALACLAFAAFAEKTFSLKELSDPVRATIEKYAEGGKINEIELEKKDGTEIYDVEVLKNGKEVDFMVSQDGEFLGFEDEDEEEDDDDDEEIERKIELSQAPQAVQDAILKIAGNNPIKEVEEEIEDGVATYEAEYMVGDVEHSIECTATGEIIELEHSIAPESLPAAALKKINKLYPGAQIKEAEAVQVFFYELEIVHNGMKKEIKVCATGDIEDDDDDHDDHDDDHED